MEYISVKDIQINLNHLKAMEKCLQKQWKNNDLSFITVDIYGDVVIKLCINYHVKKNTLFK
jgi:hypothetical protein